MRGIAAAACIALLCGCGDKAGRPASQDRRQKMQSRDEILKSLRTIDDAALVGGAGEELEDKASAALMGRQFEGLVLRTPGRIDISTMDSLPALIAVEQSAERARAIPLPENGAVLITRLGTGGCWFSHPYGLRPDKNPPGPGEPQPLPPPSPAPDASNERLQGVRFRDVRSEDMPWEAGRYALTVLSADWASNTELVTLAGGKAVPAVPRRIKLEKGDFARGANHPELKGPGAALNISGGRAFGSLRLKKDAEWPVTETGTPAIPATIALKRSGTLNPIMIPVTTPVSDATAAEAQAWFAIDLKVPAGKYFAYLVAGEYVAGPVSVEIR